jgi:hypothetical protein
MPRHRVRHSSAQQDALRPRGDGGEDRIRVAEDRLRIGDPQPAEAALLRLDAQLDHLRRRFAGDDPEVERHVHRNLVRRPTDPASGVASLRRRSRARARFARSPSFWLRLR